MPKKYVASEHNKQALSDGTETRSLYVKHFSKLDWEHLEALKSELQLGSYAQVIRLAIRKLRGVV